MTPYFGGGVNSNRKQDKSAPLEMILAIPGKYAIGKRPLSLLLGWGEQTFSRYSGTVLERFTHAELPWLSTRGELPENTASDRTIQKEQIGYFVSVCLLTGEDRKRQEAEYALLCVYC